MRCATLVIAAAVLGGGCGKSKSKSSDGDTGREPTRASAADVQARFADIQVGASTYMLENGAYPTGTTGLTPSTSCCEAPGKKCAPDAALWSADPVWSALGFSIDEPSVFRYSYSAEEGDQFMAVAVGDPGCTGKEITYTMKGATKDGSPSFELLR